MLADIKIGITGLPGAGKTYALSSVIDMLRKEGYTVGGMMSESVLDGRQKVGVAVRNIETGELGVFAHVDIESRTVIGKFGIDTSKLEDVGVKAIEHAAANCDVVVIDEIGRMEVESQMFVEAVTEAMKKSKPMIITLHKKSRNPLLQEIRRRDDVRILEVTPPNRTLLPYKIFRLIQGETH